jgi:hypothetical protein
MNDMPIIFIVGLTGVGKSTTLQALTSSGLSFTLLPNRRELTDTTIIPAMQQAEGQAVTPVRDRLERFRLTGLYRQHHPGGMLHALEQYLKAHPPAGEGTLVFDNLRGVNEVLGAVNTFARSRFIVLDAPPLVRLQRLTGRRDAFDTIAGGASHADLVAALQEIEGVAQVFDVAQLADLGLNSGLTTEAVVDAVRIIVAESQNYDSRKTLAYLQDTLDGPRLLCLDTSTLTLQQVTDRIGAWT